MLVAIRRRNEEKKKKKKKREKKSLEEGNDGGNTKFWNTITSSLFTRASPSNLPSSTSCEVRKVQGRLGVRSVKGGSNLDLHFYFSFFSKF